MGLQTSIFVAIAVSRGDQNGAGQFFCWNREIGIDDGLEWNRAQTRWKSHRETL